MAKRPSSAAPAFGRGRVRKADLANPSAGMDGNPLISPDFMEGTGIWFLLRLIWILLRLVWILLHLALGFRCARLGFRCLRPGGRSLRARGRVAQGQASAMSAFAPSIAASSNAAGELLRCPARHVAARPARRRACRRWRARRSARAGWSRAPARPGRAQSQRFGPGRVRVRLQSASGRIGRRPRLDSRAPSSPPRPRRRRGDSGTRRRAWRRVPANGVASARLHEIGARRVAVERPAVEAVCAAGQRSARRRRAPRVARREALRSARLSQRMLAAGVLRMSAITGSPTPIAVR